MAELGNSGGNREEAGTEISLCLHVLTADGVNPSLPDHRHRFVAGQCPSGGRHTTEAEPRPNQPFDPPVILLDNGVQIFARP